MQDYLYDDKGVYLLFGDCLQRMYDIVDGSVDMILADLPYGTTNCKWDSIIPFEPLWAHYKRVIKPRGAIVLTGSQPFTSALVMSNPKWFKHEWIWDKVTARGHLVANKRPMAQHENICVFGKGAITYNPQMIERPKDKQEKNKEYRRTEIMGGKAQISEETVYLQWYPKTILTFSNARSSIDSVHPTQKPVPLMEYLIKTYTNEGETVLDNTMGSGTTGVACRNTNRVFVGIENDEDYYNIAAWRILDEWEEKQNV